MARLVIALSGPLAAGKTALTRHLAERHNALVFSTSSYLKDRHKLAGERSRGRADLQQFGDELDRAGGRWVAEGLALRLSEPGWSSADTIIVVDAVRRSSQVEELRRAFGSARVMHLHLRASVARARARYALRAETRTNEMPFDAAHANATEAAVDELASIADVVVDTDPLDAEDVACIAVHRLGLASGPTDRLVDVLVGGGYGSEGKGNVVSYLAREYALLVRVGGPNAGHKVLLEAVRSGHRDRGQAQGNEGDNVYTHHSLPSGTRTSSAKILIGPGAVIELKSFLDEVSDSGLDFERLSIDPQVLLIDPATDGAAEQGLYERMGSTRKGVGAAAARRIMDRGLPSVRMAKDVPELKHFVRPSAEVLEDTYRRGGSVLLEGTQGTGLSLWHGAYPWVTSRDTTAAGCCAEAGIPPTRVRRVFMTVRSYPIRVESPPGGSSGPMRWRDRTLGNVKFHSEGEINWDIVASRSGLPRGELEEKERTSSTNRRRRVGEFDWVLLERSAQLNRPTDIALTFADYIDAANRRARRFEQLTPETIRFIEQIESVAEAPVSLISTRFSRHGIIDRRKH